MDNVKPWQIILMVLAVLALGFSVWKFGVFGGGVEQPNGYMTVDIMSGQLYELRKGKAKGMTLPAKNPDTGERTLYPVEETNGKWTIMEGYLSYISENVMQRSKVKGSSGTVEVLESDPIVHVIMP